MEQLAAFPEESWQQVVCRICKHPFAIAEEDAQGDVKVLCQTCTLLVEWFGQEEAEPSTPPPAPPVGKETPPKRAKKKQKQARQRAQLGSLLERWGDLWHSSEEQA